MKYIPPAGDQSTPPEFSPFPKVEAFWTLDDLAIYFIYTYKNVVDVKYDNCYIQKEHKYLILYNTHHTHMNHR